jgi:hypothetical protein
MGINQYNLKPLTMHLKIIFMQIEIFYGNTKTKSINQIINLK